MKNQYGYCVVQDQKVMRCRVSLTNFLVEKQSNFDLSSNPHNIGHLIFFRVAVLLLESAVFEYKLPPKPEGKPSGVGVNASKGTDDKSSAPEPKAVYVAF